MTLPPAVTSMRRTERLTLPPIEKKRGFADCVYSAFAFETGRMDESGVLAVEFYNCLFSLVSFCNAFALSVLRTLPPAVKRQCAALSV